NRSILIKVSKKSPASLRGFSVDGLALTPASFPCRGPAVPVGRPAGLADPGWVSAADPAHGFPAGPAHSDFPCFSYPYDLPFVPLLFPLPLDYLEPTFLSGAASNRAAAPDFQSSGRSAAVPEQRPRCPSSPWPGRD